MYVELSTSLWVCFCATEDIDIVVELTFCGRCGSGITLLILLHDKFLQFDWLRAVVFHLNLKYLHVKITNLLQIGV